MNAKEFINKLDFWEMDSEHLQEWAKEAKEFVCQQAKEIETLKYKLSSGIWKELTDEEIFSLWSKHLSDDIPVFARAILKEARGE